MIEIRIPKGFFDDHRDRDLPSPRVTRETSRHYFIDSEDPALPELRSDAEHYASDGTDDAPIGLVAAARHLLRAIPA